MLRSQIVDAQGVALIVIGMRLVVKVWDTFIRFREVKVGVFLSKSLLVALIQ
jgi:hypothetical protein